MTLSEEEVMDIGIETLMISKSKGFLPEADSIKFRGKLTITFSGSYYYSGSGVVANVSGTSGQIRNNSSSNPAAGADFFGLAWSGAYTASGSSCTATLQTGGSQNVYLSEASPNAGIVYEFNEYMRISGLRVIWYESDASLSSTLSKNALELNVNTAEVVLKYIHTYQALTGSISISASGSGVGAGFSLSNTPNQWGISCILTGIPY